MGFLDSVLVALFTFAMVFAILACLFILIRLFSIGLNLIAGKSKKSDKADLVAEQASVITQEADFSSGELRLKNVDEKTAAMIMAIVSDESGIPLSQLCFKSIKAIEK